MHFKLALVAGFLVSIFWYTSAETACVPNNPGSAGAEKCVQTTDEGLCNLNTECTWSAPAVPSEAPSKNVPKGNDIISLQNPIASDNIPVIVGTAIKTAMGIMGSLALVVFVYGGFRWLTAAGNSDSIEAGTSAMVWATIGIFIIFASYAILQLVFTTIGV